MPYADYHGFGQSFFEGRDVPDNERPTVGYWHYPQETLSYDHYAEQLDSVVGSRKLLVVGCAYGFALRYLIENHDWDRVYGMDVSQWAVDNAFPDVADRIYQGDALDSQRYEQIARDAQGPPRWDGIYSEYLLETLTDDEAIEACKIMREESEAIVVHRIWSGKEHDPDDNYNVKTVSEWQDLVGQHDNQEWIDYDKPEDSTF